MKKSTSLSKIPPYGNSALPLARRVKDLLGRMTLEEKDAQMMCLWQQKAETLVDDRSNFDWRCSPFCRGMRWDQSS
jgi:hypothetical protein